MSIQLWKIESMDWQMSQSENTPTKVVEIFSLFCFGYKRPPTVTDGKELQLGDKKFQTNFADFLDDLKNKL